MALARKSGVNIYTIALQSAPSPAVGATRKFLSPSQFSLKSLAQETGAEAFFPTQVTELQGVYGSIAQELSSQYSIGYTPSNSRADGRFRRIVVRVASHPEMKPKTRAGYTADGGRPPLGRRSAADRVVPRLAPLILAAAALGLGGDPRGHSGGARPWLRPGSRAGLRGVRPDLPSAARAIVPSRWRSASGLCPVPRPATRRAPPGRWPRASRRSRWRGDGRGARTSGGRWRIAAVPTALTLGCEWIGLWYPSGAARAVAAIPLGARRRMAARPQPGDRAHGGPAPRSSALSFLITMPSKSTTAERARPAAEPGMLVLVCLAAWALPGAGHLWLGRRQKGLVFLLALPAMFVIGLLLHGRIFPFDLSEPLVALAAVADLGAGLPWLAAHAVGAGNGIVTEVTYEYGNCFLIVSGLLNSLVVLDAFDIAMGRK